MIQLNDMPEYQSHKVVKALKIKDVIYSYGKATLVPENEKFVPFTVSDSYAAKHNPRPGGYYVVYKNGYESFSPAKAFEEGYTKV